jgi:bifunctional non-homologous end joining protein LigD
VTLDGEGVACDPNGVTDFALPARPSVAREVFLYAFDLLELDGRDLRRRAMVGAAHEACTAITWRRSWAVQLSDHMESTDSEAAFRHACAMGLEGIVAKRRDWPYRSGRSPDWMESSAIGRSLADAVGTKVAAPGSLTPPELS